MLTATKPKAVVSRDALKTYPRWIMRFVVGTKIRKGIDYTVVSWEGTLGPLDVIGTEAPEAWKEDVQSREAPCGKLDGMTQSISRRKQISGHWNNIN